MPAQISFTHRAEQRMSQRAWTKASESECPNKPLLRGTSIPPRISFRPGPNGWMLVSRSPLASIVLSLQSSVVKRELRYRRERDDIVLSPCASLD